MTLDKIKAQIEAHPKTALAVGVGCLALFVVILVHENKAAPSDSGTGGVAETVDPVTATTSGANTNDTDAQLQASLAATQEQGNVSIAESQNALDATKDTNASNVSIAGIQYGDAMKVALDQDNTSVLLGAQQVDLGKTQSNNALAATENTNAAGVQVNAQNNATTQQAQTYSHDLGTQEIQLDTLAHNQSSQLAQQREADNYHLSQDQISAGLVGQALSNENDAFGDLNEKHQKNRYNTQQQNLQNTLASYKAS